MKIKFFITQHAFRSCLLFPRPVGTYLGLDIGIPIFLLTTEYKVLALALVRRIKLYMDQLICPDQTGFMQDTDIFQNIQNVIDIMQYTEDKKSSLL